MPRIVLTSYNVRLLSKLWRLKTHILLDDDEETYFKKNKIPKLGEYRFLIACHSDSNNCKARGVSILISNHTRWRESQVVRRKGAPSSFWTHSKGFIVSKNYFGLYLPNEEQVACLETLLSTVDQHMEGFLFVGGDCNLTLDPLLDTSRGAFHVSYSKLCKFQSLIYAQQIVDSCRTLHIHDRNYYTILSILIITKHI